MIVRDACPACGSTRFKKNGPTPNGKQHHQCKACPRQFVQCSEQYLISDETRALIERLLRKRLLEEQNSATHYFRNASSPLLTLCSACIALRFSQY